MVFSDLKFIYIFLPVFFLLYFLIPRRFSNLFVFSQAWSSTLWEHWTARCMPCFSLPIYS